MDSTKHYPQGKRTFYALGRSADYGVDLNPEKWAMEANDNLLLIAMIEEVEGVENLDEIVKFPDLDAINFGPRDLWQSMKMPPFHEVNAVVEECTRRVISAGKVVNLSMKLAANLVDEIVGVSEKGVRMVTINILDFLRQGGAQLLHR